MIIDSNTEMLLFRYNNYKKHLFIDEHRSVLQREGHVWMLKLGRKTNNERIRAISEGGGWMILRAPKSEGGTSFLAKFTEMQEETPTEHTGIVERVENGIVYTVEGNSGDNCRENHYPVGHYEILGYGVPAY